ncbi:MAG TPA: AtpZ/AtpI family protein [Gemmatimonadales bacterium]|jgi:F0F1-type ATP synthase assembly protein I
MGPGSQSQSNLQQAYRLSGLGCMFAASVLTSVGIGWLLDRWLGTLPLFMIIGALSGATLATVSIYRSLIDGEEHDDDGDGAPS